MYGSNAHVWFECPCMVDSIKKKRGSLHSEIIVRKRWLVQIQVPFDYSSSLCKGRGVPLHFEIIVQLPFDYPSSFTL